MVGNWAANVYSEPALSNEAISKKAKEITQQSNTFVEKIKAVAQYVQNDIRYVAVEVGKERWHPRKAGKTFDNGYGDCKDKTTLMRAMLKSLDIPSMPVLCNSKNYVDARLSSPFQFNHAIIAIPVKEQNIPQSFKNAVVKECLIFDPTDPSVEIGQLPWELQGSNVVIGGHLDSVFYKLPKPDSRDYHRVYKSEGSIAEDGSFSADVTIIHHGGWAASKRYQIKNSTIEEQIDNWDDYLRKIVSDIKISRYKVKDDLDSLTISFTVKGREILHISGDYLILKPNIFDPFTYPKLIKEKRKFSIWYGAPKRKDYHIKWLLPQTWEVEPDQPKIESKCKGASVSQNLTIQNNFLNLKSDYVQYGRLIKAENYNSAKSFSRALSKVNSYTILIKQNNGDSK